MKVVFLTHYYPPEGNAPATRVHAMCKRWVAAGHDVTVITCAPNVPAGVVYPGYENRWSHRETLDGVQVRRVWTFIAPNRGFLKRVLNYVSFVPTSVLAALRVPRPDVVIATSPQFFCGWAGVWTARLKRCPFVLEIRDLWPDSITAVGALREGWFPQLLLRYLQWLEKRMYRAAAQIVTVGEGYREKLLEKGVADEKIQVISNGVDSTVFSPRPPDAKMRSSVGAKDGALLIGYVGTIGMAHGLEVIIRTALLLKARGIEDVRFVVIGDGAKRAALEQMAADKDCDSVVFVGRQPKDSIPAWLASLDACLVHLSDRELFRTVLPSKIFEAAAMGKPILLGVRGKAQEIIEAANSGICFPPEDAVALLEAIEQLRSMPDRGRALGESGRDYVMRHFQYDALSKVYCETLQSTFAPSSETRLNASSV